jgi:hypothetical protein
MTIKIRNMPFIFILLLFLTVTDLSDRSGKILDNSTCDNFCENGSYPVLNSNVFFYLYASTIVTENHRRWTITKQARLFCFDFEKCGKFSKFKRQMKLLFRPNLQMSQNDYFTFTNIFTSEKGSCKIKD